MKKGKYLIQIFRQTEADSNVGIWKNIACACGCFDIETTTKTAQNIAKGNKMGITKVRVVEVITEFNCESVSYPKKEPKMGP